MQKVLVIGCPGGGKSTLPGRCGIAPGCLCTTWTGSGIGRMGPTAPGRRLMHNWNVSYTNHGGSSTETISAPWRCVWSTVTRCSCWTTRYRSVWPGRKLESVRSGRIYPGWSKGLIRSSGSGSRIFPMISCPGSMNCWSSTGMTGPSLYSIPGKRQTTGCATGLSPWKGSKFLPFQNHKERPL